MDFCLYHWKQLPPNSVSPTSPVLKIEWLKVLSKVHRDYINNLELLKFEQGHLLTLKTVWKLIQTYIMERNSGSVKLVWQNEHLYSSTSRRELAVRW